MSLTWPDGSTTGRYAVEWGEGILSRGVSAADYNALTDPDGLQAALDDLTSANPVLFIPPGTYNPRNCLTTNLNNIEIYGLGNMNQSVIMGLGATTINVPTGQYGFQFGDGTVTRFCGPRIRGLHFRDVTGNATGGIWIRRANDWFLNVACSGFTNGTGIFSDGTGNINQYNTLFDCKLHNCHIAYDEYLTGATRIIGGQWDGHDNGPPPRAGSTAVITRGNGGSLRVEGLNVSFYETNFDIQDGQAHVFVGTRSEGFTTAFKNAGDQTMIIGAAANNFIIGGTGTIVDNLAAADGLTFMPAFTGAVATILADAGTNTTSLVNGTIQLPIGGLFRAGNAIMGGSLTSNTMQMYGGLFVNSGLIVDYDTTGDRLWFGSAQDIALFRGGAGILETDGVFRAKSVVTGSRPAAATAGKGAQMYDSTLNIPIWSDGTNWKNAAGVAV